MDIARVTTSRRGQTVTLPQGYRFEGEEVVVRHFGNGVLLLPLEDPWAILRESLAEFEEGFVMERSQPAAQQARLQPGAPGKRW